MSEPQVDLSAIRGDWYFHMGFLTKAMGNTLARASRLWNELDARVRRADLGELVRKQSQLWSALTGDLDDKGALKTSEQDYVDFIQVCRNTKVPCDDLEVAEGAGGSSSTYDSALEQFTEACRQARGLCDDLEMMREQRPDS